MACGGDPVRARPVRTDQERFHTVELAGDIFLVDDKTGVSYPLGVCGERLWQLICKGATLEEVATTLAAENHGNLPVVLQDVCRVVADLINAGAIADLRTSPRPSDSSSL